jgi:tRNA1(Val) A37 N6-methylase TrmN6
MHDTSAKIRGGYYTPESVAATLLNWVIRSKDDWLLDPSCGDGRFLLGHKSSVGVEHDPAAAGAAIERAPLAVVHRTEFFAWAKNTTQRFNCAAGNPPFIRYQNFKGHVRERALALCAREGARFSGLSSSWAPFLVAAASLLLPGGRMGFVVPAEIGHAPYAAPLLQYLADNFEVVHVIAVREKMFPELSEDCWLLYADGYGRKTENIAFSAIDRFVSMAKPPRSAITIGVQAWRGVWNSKLRPFLLAPACRELYASTAADQHTRRLGDVADVGIGYVSGGNEFFHLKPSAADELGIPNRFLHPAVRNGRALSSKRVTRAMVDAWQRADLPVLLLKLPRNGELPSSVKEYLDTEEGREVRLGYKCRNRTPWYSVPDVRVPHFFLSYMSGSQPALVLNEAGCVCTNSVHAVNLTNGVTPAALHRVWKDPFVALSCEIEGHPLGGGMLKVEPGEAARVLLPSSKRRLWPDRALIQEGLERLRSWRHCA